jgi:hypothetical protein
MCFFRKYQSLPTDQKADLVWQYGTYLACRCKDGYVISLHALEGHFIEIWSDASKGRTSMLFTFRHNGQLEPYLEKLSLPEEIQHWKDNTIG